MVVLQFFLDIIDRITDVPLDLPRLKKNILRIKFSCDAGIKADLNKAELPLPFANSNVFHASIGNSRRLTDHPDCKAVYEVTFDLEASDFKFKAGDTIGLVPRNDESDVNFIINHLDLNLQADTHYTLSMDENVKGGKIPAHVPQQCTIRNVLTYLLDLRSVLKKMFLLALSMHTKDEQERTILQYLCSKQGSSVYTSDILNKGICLLDLFAILPSCRPPIEVLLANLPRLLPRPYSIVNSGLKNNKKATICFSVMTVNNRKGLATGWLENLILNLESNLENQMNNLNLSNDRKRYVVPIYVRKNMNTFSLPEDITKPIIMIGPGTGVAPFIGFLEERELEKKNNPELILGEAWLFFGCRNPDIDYLYQQEINDYLTKGILNELHTAFSRTDDTNIKYVQDALLLQGREIMKLIKDGGIVYLCGDLNTMVDQVKEVFVNIFVEYNGLTIEEGKTKLIEMQKDKRLLIDAWS